MRKTTGIIIGCLAIFVALVSCDALGSLAGDRDELWQEVRENASYKVRFDARGGNPVPETQTVKYNGTLTQPADPEKTDGTYFCGWLRENGDLWNFLTDTVTKEITLYASWGIIPDDSAAITFDPGSNTQYVATQLAKIGDKAKQPSGLTRNGYYLEGWYSDPGPLFNEKWAFDSAITTKTLTLRANWIRAEMDHWVVTFVSGSERGEADGCYPVPNDQRIPNGANAVQPSPQPSINEMEFGGWYEDEERNIPWIFEEKPVTEPVSVYALWVSEGNLVVNFDSNGGIPARDQKLVVLGTRITGALPLKTGYTALWKMVPSGVEWNFDSNVGVNLVLRAEWTANTYTVIYDGNESTGGSTLSSVHTYDDPKNLTKNGFTRTGYTFTSWNTQPDGKGTNYTDEYEAANLRTGQGDSITLYAQWMVNTYSVSFNTDGGSDAPATQPVTYGSQATQPAVNPTKDYDADIPDSLPAGLYRHRYSFLGWYKSGAEWDFSDPVTGDILLTAKWGDPASIDVSLQSGSNIVEKAVTYINANRASYTLLIDNSVPYSVVPQSLPIGSAVSLSLRGKNSERIVSLSGNGSLFTINSGVTLVLGSNITLQGHDNNTASLVTVNPGSALEMNTGSKITDNVNIGSNKGGGVYVLNGTFTMSDGAVISGNSGRWFGGGVYIDSGGIFTMSGGSISGNTSQGGYMGGGGGGGVCVYSGTFTMSGGATIAENTSNDYGGGVLVLGNPSGNFIMNGGTITGNSSTQYGGGVSVGLSNSSSGSGIFSMSGGIISGNHSDRGGGVYAGGGTFRMATGIIYGNEPVNATPEDLRNTADSGAALYKDPGAVAQYGTFSGTTWNKTTGDGPLNGYLVTTNNTIEVDNGALQ